MGTLTATRKTGATSTTEFLATAFGAVAYSGSTTLTQAPDSTAAIAAALNAASAAGGGIVRIPRGKYKLTAGLRIPSNVHLKGEGRGATILTGVPMNDRYVYLLAQKSSASAFTLRQEALPSRTTYASNAGIFIGDNTGRENQVYDVEIENMTAGMVLDGATDCAVFGNYVHHTSGDGIAHFAYVGPSFRNKVINNHVWETGDDGISCNTYIQLGSDLNNQISIAGNQLRNIHGAGIVFWGARNCSAIGNTIESTFGAGIKVTSSASFRESENILVEGNTVVNAGQNPVQGETVTSQLAGIFVYSYGDGNPIRNVQISNNTVRTPQGSYIAVLCKTGATGKIFDVSISGNHCIGGNSPVQTTITGKEASGPGYGIWVQGVQNATITGNRVQKALVSGLYVDNNVSGLVLIGHNTISDSNTTGASGQGGVIVNGGSPLVLGNAIEDPNNRITNAIVIATGLTDVIVEHNQLGGRAVAGGAGGSTGGSNTEVADTSGNSGGVSGDPNAFKENFGAEQNGGGFFGWTVGRIGEIGQSVHVSGTAASVGTNLRLTPAVNGPLENYVDLTTSAAYDMTDHIAYAKLFRVGTDAKLDNSFLIGPSKYNTLAVVVNSAGAFVSQLITWSGSGSPTYSEPFPGLPAFNMNQHRYVGFRLQNGRLHLMVSADGITWNSLRDIAYPFGTASCFISASAGYYNNPIATPDYLDVDFIEYKKMIV